ncbi:MAG TPA: transglycosylase SLT domain-containing protein [Holophagaceae bacterium]|nr:transglycosylase SLT domain-containing protein [Holophagaceae bacterium]
MSGLWLQGLAADLGHALLHSLWQIGLVAALLWSLLTLLHRTSPRLRHVLAYGALLLALAWPLHTLQIRRAERSHRVEARAVAPLPAASRITATPTPSPLPGALPWLGATWALGVLLLGARQAGGWLWLARVKARTSPAPEAIQALGRALAARMGIRPPDLRVLAEAASPFCYGLLRTIVVLPAPCLADMDLATLEALLAHEFAHLRRWDFAFNGLQTFIDLLLFHHPLARWISSQARLERERACDEAAAAACGDARTIARALLQLEDLRPPLAASAAQGAPLTRRLPHLLGRAKAPTTFATLTAGLILGGATLLAAPRFQTPPARVQAPADLVRLADAAAATERLDPALVRALIQVESRFNPEARSPMGALGLMQVMPATARRLGFAHPEHLEENLRIGTRFLRQLMDRYNGDTAKALMAYNAGPEALDRARGEAPTEESRVYAMAVLELARQNAVEPAPVGTFFGVLDAGADGSLDLRLLGEHAGSLQVEGFQDTPEGPVSVFRILMGDRVAYPGSPRGEGAEPGRTPVPTSPRVRFAPKVPGAPLRLELRAVGQAPATVTLATAGLPVRFTVGG